MNEHPHLPRKEWSCIVSQFQFSCSTVCLRSWPSEEQIIWRVIFSSQSPQSSLLKIALTLHSETIHASQDSQNPWNWSVVWKAQPVHSEEYFQIQVRQQIQGQKDLGQYTLQLRHFGLSSWPLLCTQSSATVIVDPSLSWAHHSRASFTLPPLGCM